MAKPNYSFEKRQRELARKKKKEEKILRKAAKSSSPAGDELAATAEASTSEAADVE